MLEAVLLVVLQLAAQLSRCIFGSYPKKSSCLPGGSSVNVLIPIIVSNNNNNSHKNSSKNSNSSRNNSNRNNLIKN